MIFADKIRLKPLYVNAFIINQQALIIFLFVHLSAFTRGLTYLVVKALTPFRPASPVWCSVFPMWSMLSTQATRRWNLTNKEVRVFTGRSYSLHVVTWKAWYTCYSAILTSQRVALLLLVYKLTQPMTGTFWHPPRPKGTGFPTEP